VANLHLQQHTITKAAQYQPREPVPRTFPKKKNTQKHLQHQKKAGKQNSAKKKSVCDLATQPFPFFPDAQFRPCA
jgi:hypothetical protein